MCMNDAFVGCPRLHAGVPSSPEPTALDIYPPQPETPSTAASSTPPSPYRSSPSWSVDRRLLGARHLPRSLRHPQKRPRFWQKTDIHRSAPSAETPQSSVSPANRVYASTQKHQSPQPLRDSSVGASPLRRIWTRHERELQRILRTGGPVLINSTIASRLQPGSIRGVQPLILHIRTAPAPGGPRRSHPQPPSISLIAVRQAILRSERRNLRDCT